MDNFGVKCFNKDEAHHLLNALGENYTYTVNWEGQHYCGLKLDWQHDKEYVDISMPHHIRDI